MKNAYCVAKNSFEDNTNKYIKTQIIFLIVCSMTNEGNSIIITVCSSRIIFKIHRSKRNVFVYLVNLYQYCTDSNISDMKS